MKDVRRKRLFNDGWSYAVYDYNEENSGMVPTAVRQSSLRPVSIPHDALIADAHSFNRDCIIWYARRLGFTPKKDKRYLIYFEGVYMDCTVYVGDKQVGRWAYGYTSFCIELTKHIASEDDVIYVRIDYRCPNSRWYGGPGINRNVWIYELGNSFIRPDGIYVSTSGQAAGDTTCNTVDSENGASQEEAAETKLSGKRMISVSVETDIAATDRGCRFETEYIMSEYDPAREDADGTENIADNSVIYMSDRTEYPTDGPTVTRIRPECEVSLWDIDAPILYRLTAILYKDGEPADMASTLFGFRDIEFTTDKGFFLNGRHVKLRGVCLHTDGGAIGMAFHKDMALRQLLLMKRMGVNAIRFAHNPPAPAYLDLCDRYGMLVMDEIFDCWRGGKNPYDYGRFFDEWFECDMKSYIRRDRNHPSIIMWSIGNEIYDTHKDADDGIRTLKALMELTDMYDPEHNACPTLCSNYMAWENTQRCADVIKLIGYNYTERLYKKHHTEHPDWIIYGSETASCVQSRGVYHFPAERSLLADEDMQCSSLGNSTTSWGAKDHAYCIATERDTEYSLGQFLWSGIDYMGEPTPYHTKNSYLGLADTACFPKDAYYLYQAEWTDISDSPMIHMLPYWDYNEGQMIDVRICSNAPEVELFLNGSSCGRGRIDHEHGQTFYVNYKLKYEPGELKALAYDGRGYGSENIVAQTAEHSFKDASQLGMRVYDAEWNLLNGRAGDDKAVIKSKRDADSLFFAEIYAVDADGNEVKNANTRVKVRVSGGGYLYGLDNGDATDYESYKSDSKRLFSGKLLAIVRSDGSGEDISISAATDDSEIRVRKVELTGTGFEQIKAKDEYKHSALTLTPDKSEAVFDVKVWPENAFGYELEYEITNLSGVRIQNATVEVSGHRVKVKACADGEIKLRVLCRSVSGEKDEKGNEKPNAYLISSIELKAEGFGELNINPYSFVSASLYTKHGGDIGNGNENGISSLPQSDSWVLYENIDFAEGTEEVTIPVFELASAPLDIVFWDGVPHDEGCRIIGRGHYHKKSIWNVYQEQTFKLDRLLKGIGSFAIEIDDHKAHIKGFEFIKADVAHRVNLATEADEIYGDSYEVREDAVYGIGNNVSLVYKGIDLGREGIGRVSICGHTPMENNSVHIIFAGEDTRERRIVEFGGSDDFVTREFVIEKVSGRVDITFMFLPGCDFDLRSFRFE